MLSDTIFDYLYCPKSGNEQSNVEHFAKELEACSQTPYYQQKHLDVLKTLTQAYLAEPSFVRLMTLHRSAVAFMRWLDVPDSWNATDLLIEDGELRCRIRPEV
jgi:hypothetical protein